MSRDYRVYDEWDNGEFLTGATVDLIENGEVVHTEKIVASSEFESGLPSGYWNGRGNHATTQALSYANAWVESDSRCARCGREKEMAMLSPCPACAE